MAGMNDPDPAGADSLEDLAECLRLLHIQAGKPAYRLLEHETGRRAGQQLPGSRFKRVRLGRGNITDVLVGRKFPGKAFLLTFVDACGIALETDRRWEQAWDRLETDRYRRRAAGDTGPPRLTWRPTNSVSGLRRPRNTSAIST